MRNIPRKIYLSAGHSTKKGRDRGASSNGFIEGELTADLRNRVAADLRLKGYIPICDKNDSILSDTIAWIKNQTTNDCICIDIHWNSASPQAKGTETFVDSAATLFELGMAEELSHAVHTVMGIPKRGNFRGKSGVKGEGESHHGRLGWFRFKGQQAFMEVCFISNKSEMDIYIAKRDLVAAAIADVIIKYAHID